MKTIPNIWPICLIKENSVSGFCLVIVITHSTPRRAGTAENAIFSRPPPPILTRFLLGFFFRRRYDSGSEDKKMKGDQGKLSFSLTLGSKKLRGKTHSW